MSADRHTLPPWFIPEGDVVLGGSEDERELNAASETRNWRYTERPETGLCPYCGEPYEFLKWREDSDGTRYIQHFVHRHLPESEEKVPDRLENAPTAAQAAYMDPLLSCSPMFDGDPRRWQRSGNTVSFGPPLADGEVME